MLGQSSDTVSQSRGSSLFRIVCNTIHCYYLSLMCTCYWTLDTPPSLSVFNACGGERFRYHPVNTKHLYNICTLLVQRRRRWVDVVQMLYKCFVVAGQTVKIGHF